MIVGHPSWDDMWTLKALLHDFKLCSGLSANFNKRKVTGFNAKPEFLKDVLDYLSCDVIKALFNFLGISIGYNMRRRSYWSPIIVKVRNKISSWKGKSTSLSGRNLQHPRIRIGEVGFQHGSGWTWLLSANSGLVDATVSADSNHVNLTTILQHIILISGKALKRAWISNMPSNIHMSFKYATNEK
ncbi:unnamed protein product [Vicia faba]|uniref:Uncharacterized protein n=1 Tax=Vicia faba TaxID=3906 RepID=A0AAV0Z3A9_VICFA|nr:unnamed protein product [Vicia faba]